MAVVENGMIGEPVNFPWFARAMLLWTVSGLSLACSRLSATRFQRTDRRLYVRRTSVRANEEERREGANQRG
jgi:hypothetical protein